MSRNDVTGDSIATRFGSAEQQRTDERNAGIHRAAEGRPVE